METISYRLNVRGYLWQGTEATYSYSDKPRSELHARCVPISANMSSAEVKQYAGDFQDITDWEIIKITHGGTWEHEYTKREVVKLWKLEDSEELFMLAELGNE